MTFALKKEHVYLFEMQAELIIFFMRHHLYLKGRLTDKLGLFRRVFYRYFLNNEWNELLFQGKYLTVFVANDKT